MVTGRACLHFIHLWPCYRRLFKFQLRGQNLWYNLIDITVFTHGSLIWIIFEMEIVKLLCNGIFVSQSSLFGQWPQLRLFFNIYIFLLYKALYCTVLCDNRQSLQQRQWRISDSYRICNHCSEYVPDLIVHLVWAMLRYDEFKCGAYAIRIHVKILFNIA